MDGTNPASPRFVFCLGMDFTACKEGQNTCREGTLDAANGSRSGTDIGDRQPPRPYSAAITSEPARDQIETVRRPTEALQKPAALYDFPPKGILDRSLQAQLGRQLRAIFSDVAEEPVPDRFVQLLDALEAREKGR